MAALEIILWDDKAPHPHYLKKLRRDLCKATELLGLGGLILTQRGKIGLHTALIDCDYFDWLAGDPAAASAYQGICMEQYSWAEDTNAMLYGKQQANDEA